MVATATPVPVSSKPPADIPPTSLMLLRLYTHFLRFPLMGHSPSDLLKNVAELNSNNIHVRMDLLERAGLLVSTWESARRRGSNSNRRRVYRITEAGWLHAHREVAVFQLSRKELKLPANLPQTPFISNPEHLLEVEIACVQVSEEKI
ncbi:hypothetical protein [Deinococcus sp. UYEF24]